MDLISVTNLSVTRGKSLVLNDVSLELPSGTWLSLIGPNGAGKSTLLSVLCGLLPYRGNVTLDHEEVSSLSPRQIASKVAVVRQATPLLFDFTVEELVLLGLSPNKSILKPFTRSDLRKVSDVLEIVDLVGLEHRSALELSGGERQRVFLAQALLQEPAVLILDEPTSHLDVHHQFTFLELVKDRVADGLSVVSAVHDLEIAARYSDAICVLDRGRVSAAGSPMSVITPELVRDVFGMQSTTGETPEGNLSINFISPA